MHRSDAATPLLKVSVSWHNALPLQLQYTVAALLASCEACSGHAVEVAVFEALQAITRQVDSRLVGLHGLCLALLLQLLHVLYSCIQLVLYLLNCHITLL